MNKIQISFFACVLLVVGLFSCNDGNFPTTLSKFRVERIEPNKNGTSLYYVAPIEPKNLNMSKTWIVDSIGKYDAGDTLCFQLCH